MNSFIFSISLILLFTIAGCMPIPEAPTMKSVDASLDPVTSAASVTNISINSGDAYTSTTVVSVSFTIDPSATLICLTDNSDIGACAWSVDLASPQTVTLVAPDGNKTVYLWAKDSGGNVINALTESIILDQTAPIPSSITLPSSYSTSTSYTFSWAASTDATSGVSHYNVRACSDIACSATCTSTTSTSNTSLIISGLTEGVSYYGCVQTVDNAGNVSSYEDSVEAVTIDTIAPTAPTILIDSGNIYTNNIAVSLALGAAGVADMYVTNTAGCATDGVWETYAAIKAWTLGQTNTTATVYVKYRDSAGNETACTSDTIIHDNILPTVTIEQKVGQADPTNNPAIEYTVTFSEDVTDFTSIDLLISGTGTCTATTVSGSGQNYTITLTATTDGTCIPSLPKDMAIDLAGNLNTVSTSTDNSVSYDGTSPSILSVSSSHADGPYMAGEIIPITITFDEIVFVTGTPQLTLETGATDQIVDYTSGSGSTVLTFNYTVQAGDTSSDLEYVSSTSLFLNGGFIRDLAVNGANITLPAPAAANSLSNNKAIVIDNTAPDVATALTWLEASPHNDLTINASWTRSLSADLYNQKIQFYSDSSCTVLVGSLIDLASAVTSSQSLTGTNGGTYAYKVVSYDQAGNYSNSACSFTISGMMQITMVNAISVSNFVQSNILSDGFDVSINFSGDDNNDATVILWYCNETDSNGCNPQTGSFEVMNRGAGIFTATVAALSSPNDPSDVLNIRVVVADTDGVTGAPLDDTVTLVGGTSPADMTWTAIGTGGSGAPSIRKQHTAIWTGSKLIIWGGTNNGTSGLSDGSMYDPSTGIWTAMNTTPAARWNHSAIWTGTHMIIWGGRTGTSATIADGYKFDPGINSWSVLSTTDAPSSRAEHTAIWTGTKMVIWGGISGSATYMGDGATYDNDTGIWTATDVTNQPVARDSHVAVWDGTYMVVYGGASGGVPINDGGRFNPSSNIWSTMNMANGPVSGRKNLVAVNDSVNNKVLIWGGYDNTNRFGAGYAYDSSSDSWSALSITDEPVARDFASAVWTGNHMIVWGGIDAGGKLNTGGIYDPALDTWTPWSGSNATNTPTARSFHTATWAGNMMIIFGGADTLSYNDGGHFQ